MATYNIQMRYFNGSSYDILNPNVSVNANDIVTDYGSLNSVLNNFDSRIDELNSTISNLGSGNLKYSLGSYYGTGQTTLNIAKESGQAIAISIKKKDSKRKDDMDFITPFVNLSTSVTNTVLLGYRTQNTSSTILTCPCTVTQTTSQLRFIFLGSSDNVGSYLQLIYNDQSYQYYYTILYA